MTKLFKITQMSGIEWTSHDMTKPSNTHCIHIQQQVWIRFWKLDAVLAQIVIYIHYQLEGNFLILQVPSHWYHSWRRLTNSVSSPKDILKINSEKFPCYLLLWSGGPWSRGWKCANPWQGCSRGTCPWSGGFANTFIDICYFLGNL